MHGKTDSQTDLQLQSQLVTVFCNEYMSSGRGVAVTAETTLSHSAIVYCNFTIEVVLCCIANFYLFHLPIIFPPKVKGFILFPVFFQHEKLS